MPAPALGHAIASLRARIARIEGEGGPTRGVLSFGIPQLDRRLLSGGCRTSEFVMTGGLWRLTGSQVGVPPPTHTDAC